MPVLHYSLCVTHSIPSSAVSPVLATSPTGQDSSSPAQSFASHASAAGVPVPTASAVPPSTALTPAVAVAQAALAQTVHLSPEAQHAIKLETFNQLVAHLVQQIQPVSVHLPTQWPISGLTPQFQALIHQLLQQATASQPLPQQLVSAHPWSTALTQAVLQHTERQTASPLPVLQNWLVQQGSIQGVDGERAFTLTLKVPVVWAQAQSALGSALASSGTTAVPTPLAALQLPWSGSVQQLASGSMGLVMQPALLPGSSAAQAAQAMRTSAILTLEFQPLAQALHSAQATAIYAPAPLLGPDISSLQSNRGTDPWLLMAQAQADGNNRPPPKGMHEQPGLCNRAGCQYQGRATCAQPFCAEMNYLWSVDRAHRRA